MVVATELDDTTEVGTLSATLEATAVLSVTSTALVGTTDVVETAAVRAFAGGVEIALALATRLKQWNPPIALKLVDGGNEILAGYSQGLRDRAMRTLSKRSTPPTNSQHRPAAPRTTTT